MVSMARSTWVLDESKYLSTKEVRRLLRAARARVVGSAGARSRTAAIEYLVVVLVLGTGLRVSEVTRLTCGDLFVDADKSSLIVRRGKGGKPRSVRFGRQTRRHLLDFLRLKTAWKEPLGAEAPFLFSRVRGRHLTTRAVQKAFKRCAARAGLSPHYSIHSLRHTYACHLYRASGWNLRLVQKQLGHTSISTTQVYADVMQPDLQRALNRLYS